MEMSIAQAEHWLKSVISGQPLHRENLGEENASNGTLRGVSPVALKLAPQLQRELSQELQNAPKPAPTLSVPTMGPGGNAMKKGPNLQNRSPKPPTDNSGTKVD
jgi:hypothetical protein